MRFLLAILLLTYGWRAQAAQEATMFTASDFQELRFLQGRWKGQAPDGTDFFEEYDFPSPTSFRSRRFASDAFSDATDSSIVMLEDGRVISRWGDFTWRADRIEAGFVSFVPMNAPSSFSWRRASADEVEVTQRWQDEQGRDQSYTLRLQRVAPR